MCCWVCGSFLALFVCIPDTLNVGLLQSQSICPSEIFFWTLNLFRDKGYFSTVCKTPLEVHKSPHNNSGIQMLCLD